MCVECGYAGMYAEQLATKSEVLDEVTPAADVYAAQVELHELLKRSA